jgi:hypothetical protein
MFELIKKLKNREKKEQKDKKSPSWDDRNGKLDTEEEQR